MKAVTCCLVFLFVIISATIGGEVVSAASEPNWTNGPPVVLRQNPLTATPDSSCPTYRQDILIPKLSGTFGACMYGDERLKIGIISHYGSSRAVVQFRYSSEFHPLDGVCENVVCRYSADTDTLVTSQQVDQYRSGLVIFKNVSKRIKESRALMMPIWYVFDSTNPEYEIKNNADVFLATQAFSMSDNGKWAVVELRDHGIAVIDTTSLSVRHILTEGYRYGFGMDPDEQLAISNDGKSVAVSGLNAGFNVIDVTTTCGQLLMGDLSFQAGTTRCRASDLQIGLLFPNLRTVERPRFIGSGRSLEVVVSGWAVGAQRVMFAVQGTRPQPQLRVLSLGDSFSSGEGETDDAYYLPGTNQGVHRCHVSSRAYPAIAALGMGAHETTAKNISCSGARIPDIIGDTNTYMGQGGRLGAVGENLSDSERYGAQEQAVDRFLQGKVPQANFIERYSPEIITIGIGGNDAGLMGKLSVCAMPGICEWAVGEGITKTGGEIGRLYDQLVGLFAQIKTIANGARVYVVGYPAIINPAGGCDAATSLLIHPTEREFMQNSTTYLNQVVQSAADTAGYTFVDIEDSLKGKQLCDDSSPLAVNGLRAGDDIAIIRPLPMLRLIGAESFHPTPTGHQLIAQDFLRIRSETPQQVVATTNAPQRSSYWDDVVAAKETPDAYVTDFAVQNSSGSKTMRITLPVDSLQPNSRATVAVHSDRTQLVELIVDEDGGVDTTTLLPESLSEGFHTLHIFGINRDGSQVDLYQFVKINNATLPVITSSNGETVVPNENMIRRPNGGLSPSWPIATATQVLPMQDKKIVGDEGVLGVVNNSSRFADGEEATKLHKNGSEQVTGLGVSWWPVIIAAVATCLLLARLLWRHYAKRVA